MTAVILAIDRMPGALADDRLREALESANVPVLLATLVQLTGDRRWMRTPYLPARNRGLGENTDGGLAAEIQQEVRAAAFEAIRRWRDTGEIALPDPPPELLVELLSVMMGEEVGAEYGPMLAAELRTLEAPVTTEPIESVPEGFNVLIIGAGMSGIAAAIRLRDAGIRFAVVEKAPAVGGTWWRQPVSRLRRRHTERALLLLVLPARMDEVLRPARRALRVPRAGRLRPPACGRDPL